MARIAAGGLAVALLGLSGCYTACALVDLGRSHPPSIVELSRSTGVMVLNTTHGPLPSDVVFTSVMPNVHLLTQRHVAVRPVPEVGECEDLIALFVDPFNGNLEGRESVGSQSPTILFLFPMVLAKQPPGAGIADKPACWIVAQYPTGQRFPKPEALLIYRHSEVLQTVPLPVEIGALSWRRWLWLPVAPLLDVAGFIIVPAEGIIALVT